MGFDTGRDLVSWAWAADEAIRASDAIVAAKTFISISFHLGGR
jgi:hypothetical protein